MIQKTRFTLSFDTSYLTFMSRPRHYTLNTFKIIIAYWMKVNLNLWQIFFDIFVCDLHNLRAIQRIEGIQIFYKYQRFYK